VGSLDADFGHPTTRNPENSAATNRAQTKRPNTNPTEHLANHSGAGPRLTNILKNDEAHKNIGEKHRHPATN
jgi:hypothetical protein|tara:strand:+ start:219 stop:434 length:216 start_codon:yes stop_codon:yes gene_type:complete